MNYKEVICLFSCINLQNFVLAEFVFDQFDFTCDPKIITNVSFTNVTGRRATSISISGTGLQGADRKLTSISSYLSNDGTFEGCKIKFLERKIDVCKISSTLSSNLFISLIVKILKDDGKVIACPMKAGFFRLENIRFPHMVPLPSGTKLCIKLQDFEKSKNSKNFQIASTIRINGTYYNKLGN